MKHYIGIAVLVALAFIERLLPFALRFVGLDIHIHDEYVVVSSRIVLFWFLIGIAAIWFLFVVGRRPRRAK
jgi:amino acid transporter